MQAVGNGFARRRPKDRLSGIYVFVYRTPYKTQGRRSDEDLQRQMVSAAKEPNWQAGTAGAAKRQGSHGQRKVRFVAIVTVLESSGSNAGIRLKEPFLEMAGPPFQKRLLILSSFAGVALADRSNPLPKTMFDLRQTVDRQRSTHLQCCRGDNNNDQNNMSVRKQQRSTLRGSPSAPANGNGN